MQLVHIDPVIAGIYIAARFPDLCAEARPQFDHAAAFAGADGVLGVIGIEIESRFEGHVSIATDSRRFLSKGVLRAMFAFTFHELGLVRVTAHIAKRNKRSRRLAERLGFRLEGVKRRGFDGRLDACVYGLLADDCIWIRGNRP
jgi:RimJ/RimL family protein N-acetyltransferase